MTICKLSPKTKSITTSQDILAKALLTYACTTYNSAPSMNHVRSSWMLGSCTKSMLQLSVSNCWSTSVSVKVMSAGTLKASLDREGQRLSPRDDDGLRSILHHDGEKDYEGPLFVFCLSLWGVLLWRLRVLWLSDCFWFSRACEGWGRWCGLRLRSDFWHVPF